MRIVYLYMHDQKILSKWYIHTRNILIVKKIVLYEKIIRLQESVCSWQLQ